MHFQVKEPKSFTHMYGDKQRRDESRQRSES